MQKEEISKKIKNIYSNILILWSASMSREMETPMKNPPIMPDFDYETASNEKKEEYLLKLRQQLDKQNQEIKDFESTLLNESVLDLITDLQKETSSNMQVNIDETVASNKEILDLISFSDSWKKGPPLSEEMNSKQLFEYAKLLVDIDQEFTDYFSNLNEKIKNLSVDKSEIFIEEN